ncbi:unnamed protein product [Allacma fusca]|uniref:DOMON domain-containing protein n=1 Tax=Allacma fusca TaxID=39272 RepID=A0A8J2PPV3_9HEXA|nr:unnamed protein product [Allacma fusca]
MPDAIYQPISLIRTITKMMHTNIYKTSPKFVRRGILFIVSILPMASSTVAQIYSECCGKSSCLGFGRGSNCVTSGGSNCDLLISYQPYSSNPALAIHFKLVGRKPSPPLNSYVAMGISVGPQMGDDLVVACKSMGTSMEANMSYNNALRDNRNFAVQGSFFQQIAAYEDNGYLVCEFSIENGIVIPSGQDFYVVSNNNFIPTGMLIGRFLKESLPATRCWRLRVWQILHFSSLGFGNFLVVVGVILPESWDVEEFDVIYPLVTRSSGLLPRHDSTVPCTTFHAIIHWRTLYFPIGCLEPESSNVGYSRKEPESSNVGYSRKEPGKALLYDDYFDDRENNKRLDEKYRKPGSSSHGEKGLENKKDQPGAPLKPKPTFATFYDDFINPPDNIVRQGKGTSAKPAPRYVNSDKDLDGIDHFTDAKSRDMRRTSTYYFVRCYVTY